MRVTKERRRQRSQLAAAIVNRSRHGHCEQCRHVEYASSKLGVRVGLLAHRLAEHA